MNGRFAVSIIVVLALFLVSTNAFFIISELECAVLLRFGQVINSGVKPGLHIKIPFVDKVRIFDARLQSLNLPSSRFLTQEKKALIVDAYVKWRIFDVERYYKATSGDSLRASTLLSQRVESRLRDKVGSLTLTDVVSGQRDEIMIDITIHVSKVAKKNLGIEVVDVRIKQIDLPNSVSESVFSRMASEREKEAREYRARGKESAEVIQANADKQRQILLADAQKESDILRGQGEAEAAKIYAEAYGKNIQFYSFYQSLNAYRSSFNKRSDLLVLDADHDFLKYFKFDNGEAVK